MRAQDPGYGTAVQGAVTQGLRRVARHTLDDLDYVRQLQVLPRRVATVQMRCRLRARRIGDAFSLASATRPADMARLLELAVGRKLVVELGTGTAWTTIALALADPTLEIVSFDPIARIEREAYLALVSEATRARIELVDRPGSTGPRSSRPVDLLYIDSSHQREETMAEVNAWRPTLAKDAVVVFDDYDHPCYPGVAGAIEKLGLEGERVGSLFVHRCTPRATR